MISNASTPLKKIFKIISQRKSAYLIKYSTTITSSEIMKMIQLLKALQYYINVPEVFNYNLEFKYIVLKDCGNTNLIFFKKNIQILISQINLLNTTPKFAVKSYIKEMDILEIFSRLEYATRIFKIPLNRTISDELLAFSLKIFKMKKCFLHGDVHLDNITVFKNKIYFIDFGLSRIGPYLYDIASILNDPKLKLNFYQKKYLIKKYVKVENMEDFYLTEVFRNIFTLASYKELYEYTGSYKYKIYYDILLEFFKKDKLYTWMINAPYTSQALSSMNKSKYYRTDYFDLEYINYINKGSNYVIWNNNNSNNFESNFLQQASFFLTSATPFFN